VTGGNVFDFEPIMQRGDDPLDVGIRCDNKMKAASDEVNAGIDRSCSVNDFVDAGMGTANHDHQFFGGIDDLVAVCDQRFSVCAGEAAVTSLHLTT